MTYAELIKRIYTIRAEHCPQTAAFDSCDCSICQLMQALLFDEAQGQPPITEMPGKPAQAPA